MADGSRACRTEAVLVIAWVLAVALRITFGFELVSALGCAWLFADAALCLAPFGCWLFLLVERRLRPVHHVLSAAVLLVLVVAVRNVHEWEARSFLWRREASLLRQVDLLRHPTNAVPESPLWLPVRVDREPFRVYWPYSDYGLGSAGLVWDPAATVGRDSRAFGERIVTARHLTGPWFFCGFT
jgi:hypothetical protein